MTATSAHSAASPFSRASLSEVLGLIEAREAKLIAWGFYDLAFTPRDLERALEADAPVHVARWWEGIQNLGHDSATLLSELEEAGLVYRLPVGAERYRTRFAEGVRLLAR